MAETALKAAPPPSPATDDGRHFLARVADNLLFEYQPVVDAVTGACYGLEALLRGHAALGAGSVHALFEEAHWLGVLYGLDTTLREEAMRQRPTLAEPKRVPSWLPPQIRRGALTTEQRRPLLLNEHVLSLWAFSITCSAPHEGGQDQAGASTKLAHPISPARKAGRRTVAADLRTDLHRASSDLVTPRGPRDPNSAAARWSSAKRAGKSGGYEDEQRKAPDERQDRGAAVLLCLMRFLEDVLD